MNPGTVQSYETAVPAELLAGAAARAGFSDYLELTKPRLSLLSVLTALVGYLAALPGLSGVERPVRNGWTLLAVLVGTALAAGGVAPATLAKGVADSASAGRLVTLVVASQPVGADVWINGKGRGRTPLEVKIQSGPAHVVLVLAGYTSVTADVTASEGAKVSKELVAVAPPMTGDARFRAECITRGKLPIVVDGKETGILCPFTKLRVDPGVHKIGLFVPAVRDI